MELLIGLAVLAIMLVTGLVVALWPINPRD